MTLAFHQYANLFPLIDGQEFYDLADDIRINGLLDRVLLIDMANGEGQGNFQILDGRNRYRALVWLVSTQEPLGPGWGKRAGTILLLEDLLDTTNDTVFIRFWPEIDGDPLAYVVSKNLTRRHLDPGQRAMLAADLADLRVGGNQHSEGTSIEVASNLAQASRASVERAKVVKRDAIPEITEAVRAGQIAVSAAADIAQEPAERQAEIVRTLPRDAEGRLLPEVKKALAPVIKEIRAEKVAAKKEKRAEREQQLGRKLQALPEKSFGVAIEDFEWDHEPWSRKTGVERHPSMHYETAEDAHSPEDIVARCAERFACLADDCVLFKWTTIPHLAIAIRVMELQGFRYVTSLVWNKERPGEARGPGYWFTGEHEIVLVGVRGKVVAPAVARFRSNFSAPVGEHSEKPANIHEIVEFHWPSMPKVEFNARRARPGWTAWGFDAPEHSQANAGDGPALEGEPAGMEAPVSRVADGRTSDEDAPDSHGGASSPIADGGEASRAVDRPAPPAGVAPAECGTVVSDAAPAGRTDDAAPPANRPGRFKFPDDGGIPDFLRFQDQPKKASRPDLQGEMDVTRRDRAPAEVVDDRLQTRLPLTDDEIELQATLLAIDAGQEVEWSIMRNAIGAGFASATTTSVFVTDEGRAFLALIVGQLPAAKGEGARA